jgi:outer membrane protein assembly factor BamB
MDDGRRIWEVGVFRPGIDQTRQIHTKNTLASPTPVVADDKLFVHYGHMGTAALDLHGKVLWRQNELRYPPVHGNGASPVLIGKVLAVSCDGVSEPFLAGLDADTGAIRWKTPRVADVKKKFSFATPLAIDTEGQTQLISPASGFVGGYEPQTGRELWRVRYGEGYSVVPRPVFAHNLLFLSSGYDRPAIYAIRPRGASDDVTDSNVAWRHAKGAPNTPSPLVVGDQLFFVSDGGIASCLDALTGREIWTERLGGNFSASPVSAEDRIYFLNENGVCSVIKAGKTFELLARNELDERALASPAITDNAMLIRSESHLWRIGR